MEDFFMLYTDLFEATVKYDYLCANEENLHCAAVSMVMKATEPHWVKEFL
jgi:hypothetical protein